MKLSIILVPVASAALATASPHAMPPNPNSYHEINADGTVTPPIRLIGRGEGGGNIYEETLEGYTVDNIQGNYKYMELDQTTGALMDSGLIAGVDNPETAVTKSGNKLQKKARGKKKKGAEASRHLISEIEEASGIPEEHRHNGRRAAQIGNKKNLVVLFKFSDHTNRTVPSVSDITILMNNQGPHTLCPTGSVRDVYLKSSFGQLILDSTVQAFVTLPNTEAYYGAGNSGMSTMAHEMIRDALNALDAIGFDFRTFDTDSDGYVDAIAFLHSGYGAEWGGTDAYGTPYTNRIWSHKWSLYSLPGGKWTSNDGISVYNYHVSPSVWGTSGSTIGRIGVVAHETGHFFGLPDLYDGNDSDGNGIPGSGIGSFGLMANSWGFDGSQLYPPHMSAWSKIQLGWITPTIISSPGTYSVRQACDYPDVYMINNKFPSAEYLLIENRQKCEFDAKIPGPGLAIFHIDDTTGYTTEGFPGQSGWPTNGNHYRVALLQADGGYDLEKGSDRGDGTDLFFGGGVNGIGPAGTSSGATYPNTKAYQGGTIVDTGIYISNISAAASTMTFTVNFDVAAPTPPPTSIPANAMDLVLLTDGYSSSDTAWTLTRVSPNGPAVVAQKSVGAYGNNVLYNERYTLDNGSYEFTITDAYGDGICCSYGQGYYTIKLGGVVLKTGGSFGSQETTTFSVGAVSPTPVAPVPTPSAPFPTPTAPAPTPTKPTPSKPTPTKPTPTKPTPTKPTPSKPTPTKPTPSKPTPSKPTPSKPVPAPTVPKPTPTAPLPTPTAPKPTPTAPVPTPTAPQPTPTAPVPTPTSPTSNAFDLTLQTDSYGSVDNAWTLTRLSPNGPTVVAQKNVGSYGNLLIYNEKYILVNGYYDFTITDAYGDGICCSYGQGYYTIKLNGNVLKTGSSFGAKDTTLFTVGPVSPSAPVAAPQTAAPTTSSHCSLTSAKVQAMTDQKYVLTQPCTVLIEEREYTDGSRKSKYVCELNPADTGYNSMSIVDLEGFPEGTENFVSGVTTFFAPGSEIIGNKVVAPPGAMVELNHNARENTRKLAAVTGDRTVLAVRVIASDVNTTSTVAAISDEIFGTSGDPTNLVSQYKACSYNQLRFAPTPDTRATNGVYEVTICINVTGVADGTIRTAVINQLTDELGALDTQFNHVMLCLPPGTSGGWIAYAFVNHWLSVYNNQWCNYPSSQMHEIGHNLGLGHSGEGTSEYDDQSGMMGYSYSQDDGPKMCFNAAKSWQLGWYSNRQVTVNPLTAGWSGRLVGIADYQSTVGDAVLVKINTSTATDYYAFFNRKAGIISGTVEGGDQVMIVTQGGEGTSYSISYLVAKLSAGGTYAISNFDNSTSTVSCTVTSINLTSSPAYADIAITKS